MQSKSKSTKIKPIKTIWKTAHGATMRICDMTDAHLINAINCVKDGVFKVVGTGDDMDFDYDLVDIEELPDLKLEAERRGLDWTLTGDEFLEPNRIIPKRDMPKAFLDALKGKRFKIPDKRKRKRFSVRRALKSCNTGE